MVLGTIAEVGTPRIREGHHSRGAEHLCARGKDEPNTGGDARAGDDQRITLPLIFYPKDVAQYDVVKTALRAFKRFPIILEGKGVEPVRAFIPKEALAKLGLRQCCQRPPGECDEEKREEGIDHSARTALG